METRAETKYQGRVIPRIRTASDDLPLVPNRELDGIPGDYGLPLLGHTPAVLRNPRFLLHDLYKRYGPVFKTSFLFQRFVMLLGPDANEFVMMDREQNFSSRLGWHIPLSRLFGNGLIMRDFEDHRAHRRLMNSAFKPESLERYCDWMNPVIERSIADWSARENFRFYPRMKQLTLDIAATVFLGMELGHDADRINRAFIDTVAASIALIRVPVPGLKMWRGLRGRAFLEGYLRQRIPARRQGGGEDIFSLFCTAEDEEGRRYSDEDIVDHMIFLMMAAHDTTTSAVTTMTYALARHPEWQETLRRECESLHAETGGRWLTSRDQERLEKVEWVFKEALRMYTPVPTIPRRTVRRCTFKGRVIPANTAVNVSPAFVHHMPAIFEQPDRFDPERFSPERAEDKAHPCAFMPFGKGAHTCIGLHFAHLQVKAFVYQFLRRYRVRLTRDDYRLRIINLPIPRPVDGLPLYVEDY